MIKRKTLWTLALLATGSWSAATSANKNLDLSVKGRVTPAACDMVLDSTGQYDFGTLTAYNAQPNGYKILNRKASLMTITCPTPTHIAIRAHNHRKGSLAGVTNESALGAGTMNLSGAILDIFVGLGLTPEGEKIGGYSLFMGATKFNGGRQSEINYSDDNGRTWKSSPYWASLYNLSDTTPRLITTGVSGGVTTAISKLAANIYVQPFLNKHEDLAYAKTVYFDGMSTLELVYL